jgi:hypothetical protein
MNEANICQKKQDSARQKYPGGYAAMKSAILDPIGKTPDCGSE